MAFNLPDLSNGPIGVGIAASNDVMNEVSFKLAYRGNVGNTAAHASFAAARIPFKKGWSDKVKGFMIKAANLVIRKDLVDYEDSVRINVADSVAPSASDEELMHYYNSAPTESEVLTLMLATKVTFVMINHHVGTDSNTISGYAGKVVRAWGMENEEGIREALWVAGHWLDTRQALFDLGYPGVLGRGAKKLEIQISDDMRMRITGGVAGAAKFFVYKAVYEMLKRGVYGLVCSIDMDEDVIEQTMDEIRANPLRYHIGSKYLTGSDQINTDLWSDEDKVTLSAFVRAVCPSSTLGASPTLMKEAEVASSQVYSAFKSLKLALATTSDAEVALRVAKGKGVGAGCLWVKLGKVTQEEVEEAEEFVKEQKKAKD